MVNPEIIAYIKIEKVKDEDDDDENCGDEEENNI